jgi:hypothetical protein
MKKLIFVLVSLLLGSGVGFSVQYSISDEELADIQQISLRSNALERRFALAAYIANLKCENRASLSIDEKVSILNGRIDLLEMRVMKLED